jgi:homoaconitate hydratase
MAGQNLVEKIAQKHAPGQDNVGIVRSGNYLTIKPAYVMTHDNTAAVINKFRAIGAERMADPRQVVFTLDHNIQDLSEKNLKKYSRIEKFAREMGVDFYPAGRGIGHQIMCEEGYAWPGTMATASDSHANMYGGLGCLGTPIVRTDAAAIWATGQTWWQVPPVAKVVLYGKLKPGVTGKDVIITLCGLFNKDEVLNHAVEFDSGGVESLSVSQRLTIANMTTEWGALAGLFPIDDITIEWLKKRVEQIARRGLAGVPSNTDGFSEHPRLNKRRIENLLKENLKADPDAEYATELSLNLETVQPYISGPDHVKMMLSIQVARDKNIKINKAYLVSCVNSRLEDIAEAAEIVRGCKVAEGVEFYIAAASDETQKEAEKLGYWQDLLKAGAIALPPGCGPCIGLGKGTLKDNEVGISATNRNFKGRMGSRSARTYLASPVVVAASALAGKIDAPYEFEDIPPVRKIKINEPKTRDSIEVKIIDRFPESLAGEILFCYQDNLNTDGIYPGRYTYIDDFTPEQQAEVVMENYDPEFGKLAQEGDILVGGFNFGTGSSREQAATSLKYCGIRLIIAGSFSQTYKRNALNNGFLALEIPELVHDLGMEYGKDKLTVRTGKTARIDFKNSRLLLNGKEYVFSPIGLSAQELIVSGGLENQVKAKFRRVPGLDSR